MITGTALACRSRAFGRRGEGGRLAASRFPA